MALLYVLLFLCLSTPARAQVQISEVYPAPVSGQLEWVELQNISQDNIPIGTYRLIDNANHAMTLPRATFPPGGFALATASGVLNNAGDSVTLLSPSGITVDTMTYTFTINTSQSFALCGNEWTVADILTPGLENSVCIQPPEPTVTASPSATVTPQPTSHPSSRPFPTDPPDILDLPDILSFSTLHKPYLPSSRPTSAVTSAPVPAATLSPTSRSSQFVSALMFLILALCAGGVCIYLFVTRAQTGIMKKHEKKDSDVQPVA